MLAETSAEEVSEVTEESTRVDTGVGVDSTGEDAVAAEALVFSKDRYARE